MPNSLKKPCAQPGCPKLIEAGNTYCEEHSKEQSRYRNKRYDNTRDPKVRKFYGSSQWQKLRNMQLDREPLCEHCKEKGITREATEVDHIIPIKVDWGKRTKLDNLQSLCHSCHAKKSEEDKQKYDCL